MTAYNVVRMRVQPGREEDFLDLNRSIDPVALDRMRRNGLRRISVFRTGDRSYCFIGEWESFQSIVDSRPDMIGDLDRMRDMLEDLGGELGVTDPVSGESVVDLTVAESSAPARRARRAPKRRATAKSASVKPRQTKRPAARARTSGKASKAASGKSRKPARKTRKGGR